jgi:hypothetical protein
MKTKFSLLAMFLGAMFLVLPDVVNARFTFTTNNGAITITGYNGTPGIVVIPSTINGLPVTCIETNAFQLCFSLTNVTIGTNVTSISSSAFYYCTNLAHVAIPNNVTNIETSAFGFSGLTSVTIGANVNGIGDYAFYSCSRLTGIYFQGNAPGVGSGVFAGDDNATVCYLPGTKGWGTTGAWFGGRPTALWRPQAQTSDGSFGVETNQFGFNITCASDTVMVVEACTDLANPAWTPVGTNTLTGGSSYFSDPDWTNYPGRFYRLRSQ